MTITAARFGDDYVELTTGNVINRIAIGWDNPVTRTKRIQSIVLDNGGTWKDVNRAVAAFNRAVIS